MNEIFLICQLMWNKTHPLRIAYEGLATQKRCVWNTSTTVKYVVVNKKHRKGMSSRN